jgi:signal transduction histidine kinase
MSLLASHTGEVIERALTRDMLLSDFAHIQSTFDNIGSDSRMGSLLLMDLTGRVIFSPDQELIGQVMSSTADDCQPCHRLGPTERPLGIVTVAEDGERYFRSMHPIENRSECNECHDPAQPVIGVLLTDFSIQPMLETLVSDLQRPLLWWVGTTLAIVILVNLAIRHWVIRRIDELSHALEGFSGDHSPTDLPEYPPDEIGRLSRAFNAMTKRIHKREAENQALSQALRRRIAERGRLLKQIITAQEQERMRVARELHDELGQGLSSSALQIELARRHQQQPERVREHLDHAMEILSASTDQMYELISGLRPSVLDDLGLGAALDNLANRILEPTGVEYTQTTQGIDGRLPAEIETVLYRILQEAMTNVIRHARAKSVELNLHCTSDRVVARLTDDGIGFIPDQLPRKEGKQNGLGLLGMRERVEQFEGEFEISSRPNRGTQVKIELPLHGLYDD